MRKVEEGEENEYVYEDRVGRGVGGRWGGWWGEGEGGWGEGRGGGE